MSKTMTIGRLAKCTRVGIETIRFYERKGLLLPPERTAAGYRLYDHEAVQRLTFIRGARDMGFSLREIENLLALRVDAGATRADVRQSIQEKIAAIQEKISNLTQMKRMLLDLLETCEGGGPSSDCPILAAFEERGRSLEPAKSKSKPIV